MRHCIDPLNREVSESRCSLIRSARIDPNTADKPNLSFRSRPVLSYPIIGIFHIEDHEGSPKPIRLILGALPIPSPPLQPIPGDDRRQPPLSASTTPTTTPR